MNRFGTLSMLLLSALLVNVTSSTAQGPMPADKPSSETKASRTESTAWKIQNAMSAAPPAISRHATILDWPAKEGDQPMVLRKGTNEWTCFPDDPGTPGNDPIRREESH